MAESDPRISQILLKTKAYQDLDHPVILTSGQLGIYYINTEKLLQDDGKWESEDYVNDSSAMIEHATKMMGEHPDFEEVIFILADHVSRRLEKHLGDPDKKVAISGGQRRDWLFSGPIANSLDLPHVSLYKQKGGIDKAEFVYPNKRVVPINELITLEEFYVHHVVDLVTEGSSVSTIIGGKEVGWLPMLRSKDARVEDLTAVVDRNQGARKMLRGKGVNLTSFVLIDNEFLRTNSRYPDRALDYKADPEAWSRAYLMEHGALALLDTFDPAAKEQKRTGRFLNRYKEVLTESGNFNDLAEAVKKKYGVEI